MKLGDKSIASQVKLQDVINIIEFYKYGIEHGTDPNSTVIAQTILDILKLS